MRKRSDKVTPGSGLQGGKPIKVENYQGMKWPEFSTLAHSYWRCQEITLFSNHLSLLKNPCLDLGGGDAIFGLAAGFSFDRINLDYDKESLKAAKYLQNSRPICGSSVELPFKTGSMASCVSNSVLEHLPDLQATFSEVRRVLKPDGVFLFTITLGEFAEHLGILAGTRDSEHWSRIFGHHQRPTRQELLELMDKEGFIVDEALSYQPIHCSAKYRWMVSPAFQWIERRLSPSRLKSKKIALAASAEDSIRNTPAGKGACLFVVARLKP